LPAAASGRAAAGRAWLPPWRRPGRPPAPMAAAAAEGGPEPAAAGAAAEAQAEEATPPAVDDTPSSSRARVGDKRCSGLVIQWRGYMGWIHPFTRVQHEQAERHKGRIYLGGKDVVQAPGPSCRVKEGKIVDFYVYADHDGLGAEECRPRTVLRLTLQHSDANRILQNYSAEWSDYFSDSEYFPAFEIEHGVFLRKYSWVMPFALFELWGSSPDELAAAAVGVFAKAVGAVGHDEYAMRLVLPENDVPKAESLPTATKVSNYLVLNDPVPCRWLMLRCTKEQCLEAVKAFILVTSGAPGGAPGGAGERP